jgi:hypothetical protein
MPEGFDQNRFSEERPLVKQEPGLNIAANGRILHIEPGFTLTNLAGADYPLWIGTAVLLRLRPSRETRS